MTYTPPDQTEDAMDAIMMCDAAKNCNGFRKETILAEAIADLLWAFNPNMHIKYAGPRDELDKLYNNYLTNANLLLVATKQEKMTMLLGDTTTTTTTTTIKQLREALHDAVKIRAAAENCTGPRRAQIVKKAQSRFVAARDAYERQSGETKEEPCSNMLRDICCCFCF